MDNETPSPGDEMSGPVPELPIPPSTPEPPQNDDGPPAQISPVENPTRQKIESRVGGLFEKAGFIFKRGRGRPRHDGQPGKADIPVDFPADNPPAVVGISGPPSDGPRSAALVKKCAKAAVKSIASVGDKFVFNKAVAATGDREFAQQVVKETTITEGESDAFAEMVSILAEMYGYDPKVLALCVSAAMVGGTGLRYAITIQGLNAQIPKGNQAKSNP